MDSDTEVSTLLGSGHSGPEVNEPPPLGVQSHVGELDSYWPQVLASSGISESSFTIKDSATKGPSLLKVALTPFHPFIFLSVHTIFTSCLIMFSNIFLCRVQN